jgi:hypothetical protein
VGNGPSCSAHAVNEIFRQGRQLVVNDVGHALNIEATRSDVGGDQHLEPAFVEAVERARALRLRTTLLKIQNWVFRVSRSE